MSTTTYTDTLMTSESASQPQLVIWGTNINMHRVKMKFQEFIKCYLVHDEQEQRELVKDGVDITEPYYMTKLDEVGFIHIRHFENLLVSVHTNNRNGFKREYSYYSNR